MSDLLPAGACSWGRTSRGCLLWVAHYRRHPCPSLNAGETPSRTTPNPLRAITDPVPTQRAGLQCWLRPQGMVCAGPRASGAGLLFTPAFTASLPSALGECQEVVWTGGFLCRPALEDDGLLRLAQEPQTTAAPSCGSMGPCLLSLAGKWSRTRLTLLELSSRLEVWILGGCGPKPPDAALRRGVTRRRRRA